MLLRGCLRSKRKIVKTIDFTYDSHMDSESHSSAEQRQSLFKRLLFVLYTLAIIIASLLPADPKAQVISWDKLAHFLAYFGMSLLAYLTFRTRNGRILAISFVIAIGLVIEWVQGFVPGRVTSWNDALANGLGVLIGTAVFYLFQTQLLKLYDWVWSKIEGVFNP